MSATSPGFEAYASSLVRDDNPPSAEEIECLRIAAEHLGTVHGISWHDAEVHYLAATQGYDSSARVAGVILLLRYKMRQVMDI